MIEKPKRQASGSVNVGGENGVHASFWMPRPLHDETKKEAKRQRLTFSAFVVNIIQERLVRRK